MMEKNYLMESRMKIRWILNSSDFPECSIYPTIRPVGKLNNGKFEWEPITIKFYDLDAYRSNVIYENVIKPGKSELSDITISLLGPFGDIVEKWILSDVKIINCSNYLLENELANIELTILYTATLDID